MKLTLQTVPNPATNPELFVEIMNENAEAIEAAMENAAFRTGDTMEADLVLSGGTVGNGTIVEGEPQEPPAERILEDHSFIYWGDSAFGRFTVWVTAPDEFNDIGGPPAGLRIYGYPSAGDGVLYIDGVPSTNIEASNVYLPTHEWCPANSLFTPELYEARLTVLETTHPATNPTNVDTWLSVDLYDAYFDFDSSVGLGDGFEATWKLELRRNDTDEVIADAIYDISIVNEEPT